MLSKPRQRQLRVVMARHIGACNCHFLSLIDLSTWRKQRIYAHFEALQRPPDPWHRPDRTREPHDVPPVSLPLRHQRLASDQHVLHSGRSTVRLHELMSSTMQSWGEGQQAGPGLRVISSPVQLNRPRS